MSSFELNEHETKALNEFFLKILKEDKSQHAFVFMINHIKNMSEILINRNRAVNNQSIQNDFSIFINLKAILTAFEKEVPDIALVDKVIERGIHAVHQNLIKYLDTAMKNDIDA